MIKYFAGFVIGYLVTVVVVYYFAWAFSFVEETSWNTTLGLALATGPLGGVLGVIAASAYKNG